MRKFVLSVLAVAFIGSGAALAQSGSWAGASVGFPLGFSVHYGMKDLFGPNLDVRASLSGSFSGGSFAGGSYRSFSVGIGADLLYDLGSLTDLAQLNPYAGGGLSLGFAGASSTSGGTTVSGSGVAYDIHGLAGVEYLFSPEWGVFTEFQLGFGSAVVGVAGSTAAVSGITYGARLGVNYHF